MVALEQRPPRGSQLMTACGGRGGVAVAVALVGCPPRGGGPVSCWRSSSADVLVLLDSSVQPMVSMESGFNASSFLH